jgi:hypothetical protein
MNKRIIAEFEDVKQDVFNDCYTTFVGYEGFVEIVAKHLPSLDENAIEKERIGDGYHGSLKFIIDGKGSRRYSCRLSYGSCAMCDTVAAIARMRNDERRRAIRRFVINIVQSISRTYL